MRSFYIVVAFYGLLVATFAQANGLTGLQVPVPVAPATVVKDGAFVVQLQAQPQPQPKVVAVTTTTTSSSSSNCACAKVVCTVQPCAPCPCATSAPVPAPAATITVTVTSPPLSPPLPPPPVAPVVVSQPDIATIHIVKTEPAPSNTDPYAALLAVDRNQIASLVSNVLFQLPRYFPTSAASQQAQSELLDALLVSYKADIEQSRTENRLTIAAKIVADNNVRKRANDFLASLAANAARALQNRVDVAGSVNAMLKRERDEDNKKLADAQEQARIAQQSVLAENAKIESERQALTQKLQGEIAAAKKQESELAAGHSAQVTLLQNQLAHQKQLFEQLQTRLTAKFRAAGTQQSVAHKKQIAALRAKLSVAAKKLQAQSAQATKTFTAQIQSLSASNAILEKQMAAAQKASAKRLEALKRQHQKHLAALKAQIAKRADAATKRLETQVKKLNNKLKQIATKAKAVSTASDSSIAALKKRAAATAATNAGAGLVSTEKILIAKYKNEIAQAKFDFRTKVVQVKIDNLRNRISQTVELSRTVKAAATMAQARAQLNSPALRYSPTIHHKQLTSLFADLKKRVQAIRANLKAARKRRSQSRKLLSKINHVAKVLNKRLAREAKLAAKKNKFATAQIASLTRKIAALANKNSALVAKLNSAKSTSPKAATKISKSSSVVIAVRTEIARLAATRKQTEWGLELAKLRQKQANASARTATQLQSDRAQRLSLLRNINSSDPKYVDRLKEIASSLLTSLKNLAQQKRSQAAQTKKLYKARLTLQANQAKAVIKAAQTGFQKQYAKLKADSEKKMKAQAKELEKRMQDSKKKYDANLKRLQQAHGLAVKSIQAKLKTETQNCARRAQGEQAKFKTELIKIRASFKKTVDDLKRKHMLSSSQQQKLFVQHVKKERQIFDKSIQAANNLLISAIAKQGKCKSLTAAARLTMNSVFKQIQAEMKATKKIMEKHQAQTIAGLLKKHEKALVKAGVKNAGKIAKLLSKP